MWRSEGWINGYGLTGVLRALFSCGRSLADWHRSGDLVRRTRSRYPGRGDATASRYTDRCYSDERDEATSSAGRGHASERRATRGPSVEARARRTSRSAARRPAGRPEERQERRRMRTDEFMRVEAALGRHAPYALPGDRTTRHFPTRSASLLTVDAQRRAGPCSGCVEMRIVGTADIMNWDAETRTPDSSRADCAMTKRTTGPGELFDALDSTPPDGNAFRTGRGQPMTRHRGTLKVDQRTDRARVANNVRVIPLAVRSNVATTCPMRLATATSPDAVTAILAMSVPAKGRSSTPSDRQRKRFWTSAGRRSGRTVRDQRQSILFDAAARRPVRR